MRTIKIFLVDDHALVRETLSERLDREPDFTLIGAADTAQSAISKAIMLIPDIILMDIDMPGLISFDAARQIRELHPECNVIFLSAHIQDQYIEQALKVGAMGYLTKTSSPDTVIAAIRSVADGKPFFSEDVWARIVVGDNGKLATKPSVSRGSTLTERETEVIRYIARGLSKKEIAGLIHISVKTVDRHVANLMQKLDIHDRVDLARFAIREGLAQP